MPIRIKNDGNQGSYNPRSGGGGGTGGGGIGQLIPILIGLFGRNPKMLLIIAIIGGVIYFAGGKGCGSILPVGPNSASGSLATGANFDIKKYSATEIYEPLADNKSAPLPESISLLKYAPKRLNQGQQGSCVAWAAAYAARSIMRARESGLDPNSSTFSPSFLYNQIALEGCQGAYLPEAMKVMQGKGLAPFQEMPYNDQDCSARPNDFALRTASEFKIDGYQRLTGGSQGTDAQKVNMLAIKQNLAQGAPVVIGMMVGGSFMQEMMGKDLWTPSDADYDMRGFGGHAMCVIGYDDYKFAKNMGGFQVMNSWGEEWGKKGVAWVSYDDFNHFTKESYGIYPMGDASAPKTAEFSLQLGIVANKDGNNIDLEQTGNNTFRTTKKLSVNEEFKIEVINNQECYVYIFGQETDGSSYTLFPYTEKHSPFFGITGRRLFPRDMSMYPDEKGNQDFFAIVVSKEVLDYDQFKQKLSSASGDSYADKLQSVVGSSSAIQMQGEKQIAITGNYNSLKLIGVVVEVNK